ncbi:MAG: hypothetical protein ACI837_002985, partial [Crocinitomicaceae bacterium]
MRKIAHIINPFHTDPSSDLYTAQPITFQTMRTAKEYASKTVDVELLSAQYPEDRTIVPVDFKATKDLTRSVQDLGSFSKKIKLPILADILQ